MKYMLIHYIDEAVLYRDESGEKLEDLAETRGREAWDKQMEAWDNEIDVWDKEMKERGILVGGGSLRPLRETTTLRVRDGELLVVDGPFAETKEQIAGYSVLECADLDEAVEVSSRHPTARFGTFELRPYDQ